MKQIKIEGHAGAEAYLLIPDDNRAKDAERELTGIVNGLLKIIEGIA